jgi:DNA-binding MarR family transcriptional regulator
VEQAARLTLGRNFQTKTLDTGAIRQYFVNTMNDAVYRFRSPDNAELLAYQTRKLQDLLKEVTACCEERYLYEAKIFSLLNAEIRCLMLFQGERYLTVKGIAEKLDVAKSRVTKIVDGLISKGLVQRIEDPKDGRVVLVKLTAEGLKKSEDIAAFRKDIHYKILAAMSGEERKIVLANLDLLRATMEGVKADLV